MVKFIPGTSIPLNPLMVGGPSTYSGGRGRREVATFMPERASQIDAAQWQAIRHLQGQMNQLASSQVTVPRQFRGGEYPCNMLILNSGSDSISFVHRVQGGSVDANAVGAVSDGGGGLNVQAWGFEQEVLLQFPFDCYVKGLRIVSQGVNAAFNNTVFNRIRLKNALTEEAIGVELYGPKQGADTVVPSQSFSPVFVSRNAGILLEWGWSQSSGSDPYTGDPLKYPPTGGIPFLAQTLYLHIG